MRPLRHGLVMVLIVLLAVAGCDSSSSEESDALTARQVRRFLDRDLNEGAVTPVEVTDVRCPRTVTRGTTARATCQVTINGVPVELRLERSRGRLARTEAVLVVATLEQFVAGQYEARMGLAVIVECGAEPLLPVEPGGVVECTATDGEGATLAPVVTVEDLDGRVTVALALA